MKKLKFKGDLEEIEKIVCKYDDFTENYFVYKKNGLIENDYYNIDGKIIQEDEIDNALYDDYIFFCEDCEQYHLYNDANEVHSNNGLKYVCSDCLDNYEFCNCCNKYYDRDYMTYTAYDGYVCEECVEEYYGYCENCNEYYRAEEMHERDYCLYCDNCYEEEFEGLYGYHDFDDWNFYKLENENPSYYIGFELETDDNGGNYDKKSAIDNVYELINAICMTDGSLKNDGFEIVSHAQTYNYIMENQEKYKMLFDRLINNGYISHNSSNCGLHFHVTAPKENRGKVVSRLWAILETYKEEIQKLSRRQDGQLHWCKWLTDETQLKDVQYYYIKNMSKDFSRYLAINDTNRNTIEFRFFRGTLKFESFIASLQFIKNLYDNALNIEIPLQNITWNTLTQGKYIKDYVIEKNITTDKIIKDDYEKIMKHEYIIQFEINKIFKMLDKKINDYYISIAEKIKETKNPSDLYYVFSGINNHKKEILLDAKKYYNLKNYETVLQYIYELIDWYSYNTSEIGAKTIMNAYKNAKENIEELGVILCA